MQDKLESIKKSGVRPIGLSSDKVDVLQKFASAKGIQFPLLSDPDLKVIRQLGIANTKSKAIAHPMTILINQNSTVAAIVDATVRKRHNADQLIEAYSAVSGSSEKTEAPKSALDFKVKNIDGESIELTKYKGKVLVMVNVASKCGLTPQYEKLQALYEGHKEDGLMVLGFPCNQFGKQEPGSESEIKTFCQKNYGVEFDMFSKLDVNGDDADPLYKYLTAQESNPKGAGKVKWNFEKFVIGRDGKIAGRFGPRVNPTGEEFKAFLTEQLKAEAK